MEDIFSNLLPQTILQAVMDQGFQPTGSLFPLNSYENRVYLIELEEYEPLVAKFYRPGRWSQEALQEEHDFNLALEEAEVPVVAALSLEKPLPQSETLGKIEDFYYAFYPKFRGREHDEITDEDRRWLGRTLGRLHNIGANFRLRHRPTLNVDYYGYASLDTILGQDFIPADLRPNLEASLKQALKMLEPFFKNPGPLICVHGDCHPGNVLWNKEGPFLLDFDDMLLAPAVQDLWMLINGDESEREAQKKALLEGYEIFRPFDRNSFGMSEALRTLRMIRHTAWIGQRFAEATFQRAFPYYSERRYWETFLLSMKEQIALLQSGF